MWTAIIFIAAVMAAATFGVFLGAAATRAKMCDRSVDDWFDETARILGHPDEVDTQLPAFTWPAESAPTADIAALSRDARRREAARRLSNEH